MQKYGADEKKVHIYAVKDKDGTPLDLMNVLTYKGGKLDRVDTFIGRNDRDEYVSVGSTKDLSMPGTVFSYSGYARQQQAFLSLYLDMYHTNLHGKVYTAKGGSYIVQQG